METDERMGECPAVVRGPGRGLGRTQPRAGSLRVEPGGLLKHHGTDGKLVQIRLSNPEDALVIANDLIVQFYAAAGREYPSAILAELESAWSMHQDFPEER